MDNLQQFCRKEPEVQKLIQGAMDEGRESRRPTKEEQANKVDNVKLTQQGGNSAIYLLKRLKRDRPDLFQVVLGGEMSAHAAAIEAGFPKQLSALDQIRRLIPIPPTAFTAYEEALGNNPVRDIAFTAGQE